MSDAILAFQSQLSGVMETVFKAAMYEITRLVEDSFLEEVSRSREQVESLKQRLQWSESRRREREGGGRVRCADCGRAGVPCEETENTHSGTQPGADESRGLKQEKVLEGAWSSCPGETSNVGPPSTPQEPATPSPITAPDMSSQMSQQTHVDGDRLDAMLKEEGMQAAPPPDHLQERWSVCLEGQEGPEGEEPDRAFGEQRLQLCEEEWGPGAGMGADPGRDGSAEGLARAYSARYGVEEELGAALEAESKGEYMVAMLSGSGELDGRSLEDSLLRADGQLNFPAELDPTNSTAEAATHPFGPRGRRPSLGDPQGSPPGDSNVGDLDCLLINEDGYLQDTDGRYRGLRRSRGRGRGEQRGLGPSTEHLLPMPDNSDDQHQGELFSLTHHQRRHSCSQCQVSFPDLGALKAHLLTHRAGSAYTCTQCGKSFTQACNLKVHQRIHSGEGLHLCSHCGKGFISFADLKRHKCSHTSDKPYCCTLCGNKFSRLWNLKLHRRIHTQEKPHRCTQCGKSFTRADILKVHQRTHTGERPYCCAVCGLSFKRLDHLKSHQRKHS